MLTSVLPLGEWDDGTSHLGAVGRGSSSSRHHGWVFETESQEFLSVMGCGDRGLAQSQAETSDMRSRTSKGHS